MQKMNDYIDELYKLVLKSHELNEVPVGAIIIYNNMVIGKGYNNRQSSFYVCGHAEINAIKEAEKYMNDWRLNDCILISSLYPCQLCQKAIEEARIDEVYYLIDGKDINNNNYNKINYSNNKKVKEINKIFNDFFINLR